MADVMDRAVEIGVPNQHDESGRLDDLTIEYWAAEADTDWGNLLAAYLHDHRAEVLAWALT